MLVQHICPDDIFPFDLRKIRRYGKIVIKEESTKDHVKGKKHQ